MGREYSTTMPDGNGAGHGHGRPPEAGRDARTVPDDRASLPWRQARRQAPGVLCSVEGAMPDVLAVGAETAG